MTDDERGLEIRAIAGVSLNLPLATYGLSGLSFGDAELARAKGRDESFQTLVLTLTPEAAMAARAKGGSGSPRVTLGPIGARESYSTADDLTAGLCRLIVEHRLLSRPELLRGTDLDGVARGSAEAVALSSLCARLRAWTHQTPRSDGGIGCIECEVQRLEDEKAAEAEKLAAQEKSIAEARSRTEADRLRQAYEVERRGARGYFRHQTARRDDCPHVAWGCEALRVLCARHPELAFEIVGILNPTWVNGPPRFLITRTLFKESIGQWLMGRSIEARGWSRRPNARPSFRYSAVMARRHAAAGAKLAPEERIAVGFAAGAWGFDATPEALGWRPESAASDLDFDLNASPEENLDIPSILPTGLVALPPKVPAKKAVEKKAVEKKAVEKKAVEKKTVMESPVAQDDSASSPPTQELTAANLRALGYDAAKIKSLLKSGALERLSFGWYRFVRPGG